MQGREDPLEKGMATTPVSILAWKIPVDRGGAGRAAVHGVAKESGTTITLTVMSQEDIDLLMSEHGCDNSSLMELTFFSLVINSIKTLLNGIHNKHPILPLSVQFSSVQSLSRVQLFVTP